MGVTPGPREAPRALPLPSRVELGEEWRFLAREAARLAGPRPPAEGQALQLLLLALFAAWEEGSTRLPLDPAPGLERRIQDLAGSSGRPEDLQRLLTSLLDGTDAGLGDLVGGPLDYRPVVLADRALHVQRFWFLEQRLARRLADRVGAPGRPSPTELDEVLRHPTRRADGVPVQLSEAQARAVATALDGGRLTVITGGPGTGKTSIVVSLLRAWARSRRPDELPTADAVALAAPTGRAAERLRRSLLRALAAADSPLASDFALAADPPQATTLHRLLGARTGGRGFRHHAQNPLRHQLVIVDEASMVDLLLFERTLRALPPSTPLILLGDADQLPPVEVGAPFHDLAASPALAAAGRVVELDRAYRQASDSGGTAVAEAARALRAGARRSDQLGLVHRAPGELTFEGVELTPALDRTLGTVLDRWYHEHSCPPALEPSRRRLYTRDRDGAWAPEDAAHFAALFGQLDRQRLLCAIHGDRHTRGTVAVNLRFHELRVGSESGPGFGFGEPVTITRNDPARALYNGDQGLVLRVRGGRGERATLMAVFPRAEAPIALPVASLRGHLELAWASSVHRAQGSEHDRVLLVLPESTTRAVHRELLYTAMTRARRGVTVVGSAAQLEAGLALQRRRSSSLAPALERALGEAQEPLRDPAPAQLELPFGGDGS